MRPRVSIIVPVYKVEDYLQECVESLLNQTFDQIEIILVDDGSPDNCGILCDEYQKKYSNVVVIHKKNGGLSSARNAGLKIAQGEYIGFVDSDDYVNKNMIKVLYEACEKHGTKMSACNYFYVIDEKIQYEKETNNIQKLSSEEFFERLISTQNRIEMVAWNKLYHRSIFDCVPTPFPEGKLFEDLGSMYKLVFTAGNIAYVDSGLYYYRRFRNGAITTNHYSAREWDRIEFGDKMVEFIRVNAPNIYIDALNFKFVNSYLSVVNCMITSKVYDSEMYKTIKKEIRNNRHNILIGKLGTIKKIQVLICGLSFNLYRILFKILK